MRGTYTFRAAPTSKSVTATCCAALAPSLTGLKAFTLLTALTSFTGLTSSGETAPSVVSRAFMRATPPASWQASLASVNTGNWTT